MDTTILQETKKQYIESLIKYDIERAENLRQQIGKEGFETITEEYLAERLEVGRKNLAERFDKLVDQINEKTYTNYKTLFGLISVNDNKTSKDVFQKVTGLKIPKTIKEIQKMLLEFYGADMIATTEKELKIQAELASKEYEENQYLKVLDTRLIRLEDKTIVTYKKYIEIKIADGFNRVVENTKGVRRIVLWKGEDRYINFKTKEEMWYIKKLLNL